MHLPCREVEHFSRREVEHEGEVEGEVEVVHLSRSVRSFCLTFPALTQSLLGWGGRSSLPR